MFFPQGKHQKHWLIARKISRLMSRSNEGALGEDLLLMNALESILCGAESIAAAELSRYLIINDGLSSEERSILEVILKQLRTTPTDRVKSLVTTLKWIVQIVFLWLSCSLKPPLNYSEIVTLCYEQS